MEYGTTFVHDDEAMLRSSFIAVITSLFVPVPGKFDVNKDFKSISEIWLKYGEVSPPSEREGNNT